MTLYIPEWLLWTIAVVVGAPLALLILVLAVFGAVMAWSLKDGVWR